VPVRARSPDVIELPPVAPGYAYEVSLSALFEGRHSVR
jgi:hypothetical protein